MHTQSPTPRAARVSPATRPQFQPLEQITRPAVTTAEAAHYLNRSPQTLRTWSCTAAGPINPLRVGGRLLWPTAELRRMLGLQERAA